MTEYTPDELAQVTQDMDAAREAFSDAARRYNAALNRYVRAWERHREDLRTSDMPYVAGMGKSALYENQIEGAKEHREMLKPIIEYFG